MTSSHSEGSPRSHERRRFIRQRVRSLAYLDVVPNNGGIVINLSENGLALQAVNPFDETRVSLRIQPPKSRKRIEVSAEITWLSESKTEAGLQFLGLTEEARLEIADWVADESGLAEQRALSDSPALPAQQVPSKPSTPESPPVREKWSAMLRDSAPQPTLANQQAPEYRVNSEVQREDVKLQRDVPQAENLPRRPTSIPISNVTLIQPPAINENVKPVKALTPSASISRVVEFPTPGSHVPAVNELLRELSSLLPAAVTGKATEVHSAVAPAVNAESLRLLAHRFRKPLAIGALAACAAVIFLVVGLAIIRQWPPARPAKLAAQEAIQVPNVASASRVARDTSSLAAASNGLTSHSGTKRHKSVGAIASSPHWESSQARYGGSAHSRHRVDTSNSLVGKFSSPIEAASLGPANRSPDATIASAPVLFIKPTSAPRLVVDSPEMNPPAPANIQRRSDCYLLYRVEPLYPREAKAHHIEGTVTIHLQIGTDGRVQNLRELSGPSLLVPAALDAAREWRFIPALVDGQAVEAEKDVNIIFQLAH
ncbi:MAG: TonB family protein [Candidatus Acidiferrales bacterium]